MSDKINTYRYVQRCRIEYRSQAAAASATTFMVLYANWNLLLQDGGAGTTNE